MKKKRAKVPEATRRQIEKLIEEGTDLGGKTVLAILELKLAALEKQFQEQMKKVDEKYAGLEKSFMADFEALEKHWQDFLESEKARSEDNEKNRKKHAEMTQAHNAQIETGLKTLVELVKHLLVEKK